MFLSQLPIIPIPVGSCTYNIQDILDLIEKIPVVGSIICENYLPGNGCELPMLPGHYGLHPEDDPIHLPVINLPEVILRYLIGTWEMKVEVYDQKLKEVLCTKANLKFI